MKFIFLNYHFSPDIKSPQEWTNRIHFYVGSLECLSKVHTVIRVDQINYEGNFIHNGVQYFCVKPSKNKNYIPRKLNHFVKRLEPDVVVVSSFLFPLQVVQLRWCLGKNVKIIMQHHAERPYTGIKKFIQRQVSGFVDAYIFASREIGIDWVQGGNLVNEKKIYEIMEVSSSFYPLDKIFARSKTHVNGDLVFLWAGRLNENKDPITVVKAFLEFSKVHTAAKLYMIYQSAELLNCVRKLVAREGHNISSIVLIGAVPHEEMLYWFNSANFLISGSHYEGSGTVIAEAMSCGCVPIITDIPSFRTITANGDCGFLYEVGNENALFSTLKQAIQVNVQEKRNKALKHFKNNLSFDAIARKIYEVAAY